MSEKLPQEPTEKTHAGNQQSRLGAKSSSTAPASKSPLAAFSFFLILVVIGALGAAGWYGYPRYVAMTEQVQALQMHIAVLQAETAQYDTKLQADLEQAVSEQQALREQLQFNTEQLAKLPGAERQDWLVAEAEYLMRIANQRLQLERDWSGALNMLQAADNVLVETRNPRFNAVRAVLAQEMLALRSMPSMDTDGAVLRIQALQDQIMNLPWIPDAIIVGGEEVTKTTADSDTVSTEVELTPAWYITLYDNISSTLKGMVRIRVRSEPVAPLSPDQHYFLQQNMQLMLEQAQVALLREQPTTYIRSLTRVENWLKIYLLVDDERTRAAFDAIEELKRWPVAPARPDISASLLKLQQLSNSQRRTLVPAAGESA